MTYHKTMTGSVPLCPLVFSWFVYTIYIWRFQSQAMDKNVLYSWLNKLHKKLQHEFYKKSICPGLLLPSLNSLNYN